MWRRIGIALLVILLHVAAVIGLVRAFAPDFSKAVVQGVTSAFDVTITAPSPQPSPTPARTAAPAEREEGAAAPPGKRATPDAVAAPRPRIVVRPKSAPPVASTGSALSAGSAEQGAGTGAGGEGQGTGAGGNGVGPGGGGAAKPVKIAGDINSSRDYPKKTRELRRGDHVVIVLTIGTDGRPRACRVHRPSRDPDADRITCRLATQRFRFRPALDFRGEPVESDYGWQQRWFAPQEN